MPNIDKSLSWDGLFQLYTDGGAKFMVKIKESAPNTGSWTINFVKSNDIEVQPKEVFLLMKGIADCCNEYANEKNINSFIFLITGFEEESLQKSKIFTRWMENDWNYEIIKTDIKIPGTKLLNTSTTSYSIRVNRKEKEVLTQQQPSPSITQEIKFCFNCGTQNNSYLFCPSCGTKLKQA